MKINDYIRTKYGIAKIINIEENPYGEKTIYKLDKAIFNVYDLENGELACLNPLIDEMSDKFDTHFGDEKEIIKSSSNIIDLIEVGDYVNGRKIETKYYSNVNQEWVVAEDCGDDYYDCKFTNENIKTVVTKEQMSVMEYRINE